MKDEDKIINSSIEYNEKRKNSTLEAEEEKELLLYKTKHFYNGQKQS